AGPDDLGADLVDVAVDRLVEVLGQQEVRNAIEGFVVDQDGAQQRLLGLDVVRREANLAFFFRPQPMHVLCHGLGRLSSFDVKSSLTTGSAGARGQFWQNEAEGEVLPVWLWLV